MDDSIISQMYEVINDRKESPIEGSYTNYLFTKGIDKILKKIGEETTEVIVASKNNNKDDISNEICDLIYHMLVLMVEKDITVEDIEKILLIRREKIGNSKGDRAEIVRL